MGMWEEMYESVKNNLTKTDAQKAAADSPVSYEPLTEEQQKALRFKSLYDTKGNYKKD